MKHIYFSTVFTIITFLYYNVISLILTLSYIVINLCSKLLYKKQRYEAVSQTWSTSNVHYPPLFDSPAREDPV